MAAKLGLVLDCADPERLAEFWSAAIGYATLGGAGNYVLLVDESGQQPKLLLQRVDEPKAGKNRMHFDIETPPVDEEVALKATSSACATPAKPARQSTKEGQCEFCTS